MSKLNYRSASALLLSIFAATYAHGEMASDVHGQVGYDTVAERDAAVSTGTAKFYTSHERKPTLSPPAVQVVAQAVEEPKAPTSIVSAVQLARGEVGMNQFIGLAGVLTIGAILFNGGDTGTSGTTGTTGTF